MSEAQAYLALPHFLKGFALNKSESVRDSSLSAHGGVTCWPEAVQYLLRSYATSGAIQSGLHDLRGIQQLEGEDERNYCNRLDEACRRVGNIFPLDEKCTMSQAGLIHEIRLLVSRHRETNRCISFLDLEQFARAEGSAHRARIKLRGKPKSL